MRKTIYAPKNYEISWNEIFNQREIWSILSFSNIGMNWDYKLTDSKKDNRLISVSIDTESNIVKCRWQDGYEMVETKKSLRKKAETEVKLARLKFRLARETDDKKKKELKKKIQLVQDSYMPEFKRIKKCQTYEILSDEISGNIIKNLKELVRKTKEENLKVPTFVMQ